MLLFLSRFGVAFFCRTGLTRCSHFEAGGMGSVKKGPGELPVIFSASSARSVRQRAYATCQTKQNASAPNTEADTLMCHRFATARRHSLPPSVKSLVIPTLSLPVQSGAQGEPPRSGSCSRRIGEAKDAWFKRWRLSDIRRRLGLPGHVNEERTHDSYAQIPRIGSKGPWPAASVDFTKREAGVVRVTRIITRLLPWSRTGTIRSAWRSRAGFVKSAMLR